MVQLIAAHRPVLRGPELAVPRVDGEALRIAVTVSPNRWTGPGLTGERIVGWNTTVRIHAVNLAERAGQILRSVPIAAIADREKELAVVE